MGTYEIFGQLFNNRFVLNGPSPIVTDEAQIEVVRISCVSLIIDANGETNNFIAQRVSVEKKDRQQL